MTTPHDERDTEERLRGWFREISTPRLDSWRHVGASIAPDNRWRLFGIAPAVALSALILTTALAGAAFVAVTHQPPHATPTASVTVTQTGRPTQGQTPRPTGSGVAITGVPSTATAAVTPGATAKATAPPAAAPSQPPPPPGAYPSAANTGTLAGVPRTPSGDLDITTNGAVVQNLDLAGSITVHADNVTIRNVRLSVDAGSYAGIVQISPHAGLTISNVEIIGETDSGKCTGVITTGHSTITASNIHGCGTGVYAHSDDTISDNYIHDPVAAQADNGIQTLTSTNLLIRHNTITYVPPATSCIALFGDNGAQTNVTVENNLLDGGGWTVYLDSKGSGRTVTNNRVGRHFLYGPWNFAGQFTFGGNVWSDTGAAMPPP